MTPFQATARRPVIRNWEGLSLDTLTLSPNLRNVWRLIEIEKFFDQVRHWNERKSRAYSERRRTAGLNHSADFSTARQMPGLRIIFSAAN
jgi:hypothetical protein